MAKNHNEQTLSDLFDESQKLIEKFNKDYEQTLEKIKAKLEVEKWQEQEKADERPQ